MFTMEKENLRDEFQNPEWVKILIDLVDYGKDKNNFKEAIKCTS